MSEEERRQLLRRLREELELREEILFAYVLGSFAEGLPFRDVDVAVWAEGVEEGEAWDYETKLSVDLTLKLDLPIDVKLLNYAPLGFKFNATKGELLFSRDEELRLRFVEETWVEYMDFSWLSRYMLKEALR
ncbi:nucleotidyltransferase domain-containing protein [Candidatus Poribacteria bacterium]|nr:MAG: nucleotidyltransferase domain-containing protein [Candidatus Poribacteria bacterium]